MRSPRSWLCRVASLVVLAGAGCSSNDDAAPAAPAPDDAGSAESAGGDGGGGTGGAGGAGGSAGTDDAGGTGGVSPDGGEDAGAGGDADADGEAGQGPTVLIDAPVRRYDYAFDITTAAAQSKLSLDVPAPGGNSYAVACMLPGVNDVTWNGAPASSFTLDNQQLTVQGESVAEGTTLEVGAKGAVEKKTAFGLDVGFSVTKDLAGGDFTYLLSWVGGCDRFGPCDDRPSSLAEFYFDVTHPPGGVVLCPGVLTPGQTLTSCAITGTLGPTYSSFAIASDPLWVRAPVLSAAGVELIFYEVPGGQLASSLDAASMTTFLEWSTGLFGPMPYGPELRIAGAPTAWLGFEHPANIILHETLPFLGGMPYGDAMMHVIVHETVHQWAGARTTLASAEDFVWKEGTAEYLTYVFEDEYRPPAEAAASLAYWDEVSLQSDYHPRPTDSPPPAVSVFYGDVYGPGPMLLFVQLESMLGRPVVLQAIQAFLDAAGARSVADLKTALEQASGQDLTAYFDAWVYGAGKPEWPTFDVAFTQAGGDLTVSVTQQNASNVVYPCAIEVEVQGATQSTRALVEFGLSSTSATASATVPFAEAVDSYVLDPDHRVVGRDAAFKASKPEPKRHVWIL